MNQHEWVYGCYAYYLDNYIEPGNPEDGVWEDAHWPVPKCLGGTKTIPLLKEHHAVQGVLQSEEWNHPCIFSWERAYLTGHLLDRYSHWMRVKNKKARASVPDVTVAEHCSHMRSRRTHEGFVAAGKSGARSLHNQRWRCTVTGFVTTPGPLTQWQRKRGIDPTNRERVR